MSRNALVEPPLSEKSPPLVDTPNRALAWQFAPRRLRLIAGGVAALALVVLAGSVAALALALNQLV
jgi:hypothetical protein